MRSVSMFFLCACIFEAGCIGNNSEIEVVSSTDPNLPVGISAFELLQDAVKVTADPNNFGMCDSSGQRVGTVVVKAGDTFHAIGFNRGEDWTLTDLPSGHALFRVKGTQSGCIGVWPFGPPVYRFSKTVIVCPHGEKPAAHSEVSELD